MLSKLDKIIINSSFSILVLLGNTQTAYSADRVDDLVFPEQFRPSKARGKENLRQGRKSKPSSGKVRIAPRAGLGASAGGGAACPLIPEEDDRPRGGKKRSLDETLSPAESQTLSSPSESDEGSAVRFEDFLPEAKMSQLIILNRFLFKDRSKMGDPSLTSQPLGTPSMSASSVADSSPSDEDQLSDVYSSGFDSSYEGHSPGSPPRRRVLTPDEIDLDQIVSPKSLRAFRDLGGEEKELKGNISVLSKLRSPVRNLESFSPGTTYTPAARLVMPRLDLQAAVKSGLVASLPMIAHVEPIAAETPAERAARIKEQKEAFAVVEAVRGYFPKQLNAMLDKEVKPWPRVWQYVEMREAQYLAGTARKMRWPELAGALVRFVVPYMNRIDVSGYRVYFGDTLDFNRQNEKGIPNHKLMSIGRCPIGPDGEVMNYHHGLLLDPHVHKVQLDPEADEVYPYMLFLITNSFHTKFSGYLHPKGSIYQLPLKDIDRGLFGDSREEINRELEQVHHKQR